MPKFSQKSLDKLNTCHPDLIKLFTEVIKEYDCTILVGHRGEAEQNEAFAKGNSKLKYPNSKHNKKPSLAVDVAPYPIDFNNIERFKQMIEVVKKKAKELNIDIISGSDWDDNPDTPNKFNDLPHFELKSSINK